MGNRPIDAVLEKLPNATRRNGGWLACCPAHDDKHPSLAIGQGSDGQVLLHCHAGCEFGSVVAALGLAPKDLFTQRPPAKKHIAATYDYTDEAGHVLYQTVRFDPKDFRQRRPNGRGGWEWNLTGVKRVLYNLPQIVKAGENDTIFVCEGEKSADAINSLGLIATTNPLGAGKWHSVDQEPLTGRHIVMLPDEDAQGRNHAAEVVNMLKSVAASRKIVHLPAVAFKKSDPADWVTAGGTRDELLALCKQQQTVEESPLYWDNDNGPPGTYDFITALNSLGYEFRLNICNDQIEVNKVPISDVLRAKMRSQMRDLNYRQVNVMEDAWTANAAESSYHPIRQWLNELTWDGEDHIAKLGEYVKDRDGQFPLFFRRWAVGAVARACEPRSCQNRMLVLDGGQGVGKSYFVQWLARSLDRPEAFTEGPIAPDNKDYLVRLISTWIWEVCELGSTTRRSDRESLKYFLSMQQVTVRKPYGHYDMVKPALSSFIGTINNVGGFLDDPTGYRRFMIVRLESIDWKYALDIDPAQLWAQAKTLYDNGEAWELSAAENEIAERVNLDYEVVDPLVDLVKKYFEYTGDASDSVATTRIREVLSFRGGWKLAAPRGEAMAIAGVMLRHFPNAKKARRLIGGTQERCYTGMKER